MYPLAMTPRKNSGEEIGQALKPGMFAAASRRSTSWPRGAEPEIHRVGPELSSWPSVLTENSY
jgi:hypothetical protein